MLTRRHFVGGLSGAAIAAGGLSLLGAPAFGSTLPRVAPRDFAAALQAMREIVGKAYVFVTDEQLVGYRDHFAMGPPEDHAASGAVAPRTVEEVVKLLKVANDHGIPVWTISTGRNLGYGGAAPRMPGTLVLDLKRMNRILEVNEAQAYAVVEPGVSYKDLFEHLQRIGSKLWIDCAAPAWGGVIGNLMDRGVGYTPMGEHFLMQQCGMQVVLSDGTVVETGLGAQVGNAAQYTYRYGHGPWIDGLFTQSNFGVVTRMGVQLMPEPPGYRPYMITFEGEEAIEPLTEAIRPLKLAQIIPNAATSTELIWEAAVQVRKDQYYDGSGPLPASARRRIKQDLEIGDWNFYGALYGPEPVMDANWEVVADSLGSIPGAKIVQASRQQESVAYSYRAELMRGVPNLTEFGCVTWIPNAGHVGFGPVVPVDGELALKQYRRIKELTHQAGFDYFGEFVVGWRDMHHIFMPAFQLGNEEEGRRLRNLVERLIDEAAADRYGVYRTHLDFMDKVAGTYDWNDGALGKLNAKLKKALDPTGILAPGKSGIWPEARS